MTTHEHAAALADSLSKAVDCIDNYLGPDFIDDTWRSAVDEYKWSLVPTSEEPFHYDMLKAWDKISAVFWMSGVTAPRHRVCAAHLRAIAERLKQHDEVSNLLKHEALRAEGKA
jgi:hypothetical protein